MVLSTNLEGHCWKSSSYWKQNYNGSDSHLQNLSGNVHTTFQTIPQPWKETLERNPGKKPWKETGENGEPF
jgi:hypothetical protein